MGGTGFSWRGSRSASEGPHLRGEPVYSCEELAYRFPDCDAGGVDRKLGRCRRLVGIVDAGEVFDLPAAGSSIKAFGISCLANLERSGDKDLEKAIAAQLAHELPGLTVGRDQRRHHCHAVRLKSAGQKPHPPDVCLAFLPSVTGIWKQRSDLIAVWKLHFAALGLQSVAQGLREGGLP